METWPESSDAILAAIDLYRSQSAKSRDKRTDETTTKSLKVREAKFKSSEPRIECLAREELEALAAHLSRRIETARIRLEAAKEDERQRRDGAALAASNETSFFMAPPPPPPQLPFDFQIPSQCYFPLPGDGDADGGGDCSSSSSNNEGFFDGIYYAMDYGQGGVNDFVSLDELLM